eukprot:scaffold54096_cov33-Tisochrysis_lutea.AAC.1
MCAPQHCTSPASTAAAPIPAGRSSRAASLVPELARDKLPAKVCCQQIPLRLAVGLQLPQMHQQIAGREAQMKRNYANLPGAGRNGGCAPLPRYARR